jgi:hypothetical protein
VADSLVGEVLGQETEKPEGEAQAALARAEAFAATVAVRLCANAMQGFRK